MSPELLDADLEGSRRTKCSDRYALGMVIYEVLSGRTPFYQYANWSIPTKVAKGIRPERPREVEGVWFTDDVWEILERCWVTQPKNRPRVEDVLRYLNQASRSLVRPSLPRVAVLPAANSPTTNPFDVTDERDIWVDEDEKLPSSHSSDDHDPPPKDATDDNAIYPSFHKPPILLRDNLHPPISSSQTPVPAKTSSIPPNNTSSLKLLIPKLENPSGDSHPIAISPAPVSYDYNIPASGRLNTKKALLIGIGRTEPELKFISSPIAKVRAFEAFLKGSHMLSPLILLFIREHTESYGYTDITVMADEDRVKERYQPTRRNMVRYFSQLVPC